MAALGRARACELGELTGCGPVAGRGNLELTACESRGSDSDGAKLTAARAGTDAVGPGGRGN